MIASVWDWEGLCYDYYEVPGYRSPGGWEGKPAGISLGKAARSGVVGIYIEDVLPVLPQEARYLDSGEHAKGQIMREEISERGLALGSDEVGIVEKTTAQKYTRILLPALGGAMAGVFIMSILSGDKQPKAKVATVVVAGLLGMTTGVGLGMAHAGNW